MDEIQLRDSWDELWGVVGDATDSSLWTFLTIVGVLLVVISIITYLWNHRRGNGWGNGSAGIIGMLIVGTLLMAPQVLIPIVLMFLDWVINFFIRMVNSQGIA